MALNAKWGELFGNDSSGTGMKEPLILVTVVSGCYRAPEGADLNGVH
jgi:hypothetical protein